MVLLRQKDVDALAPSIGRIVLHYAEFESVVDDLYSAVEEALDRAEPGRTRPRRKSKLNEKLDAMIAGLAAVGAHDFSKALEEQKDAIITTATDRHHVIHGHWWWHYAKDTVNTAKVHPKTGEMEYRKWDVESLDELIEDIRDREHFVYQLNSDVREKLLGEPEAFFMVEDADGEHVPVLPG